MKKTISLILMLFLAVFTLQTAKAQVLLTEDFDYTAGDQLTSHGWSQQGATPTNPILVHTSGLTYPGYIGAGVGNAARVINTGQDVYNNFATVDTNTSSAVYFAAVVYFEDVKNVLIGDYFIHFANGTETSDFRGRVFARKNANDSISFGISKSGSAASAINFTPYDYPLGDTFLIVVKYEIVTGGKDLVSLWINPTISTTEPSPNAMAADNLTGNDASAISSIQLRQGNATNGPTEIIDGIRVARTWTNLFYNTIDWANLQWPASGSINQGASFTVYAQAWINGITADPGATPGLQCWIGYNTADTDPSTWTNWVPATFNVQAVNNDEFMADIGTAITNPGTYYYASRWQYSAGPYYYGGTNDGFWDGTNHLSGVLTVNATVNQLPQISNIQHTPSAPNSLENVDVTADITDADGTIKWANLYWATSSITDTTSANKVPMTLQSGSTYTAQIPAQANGTTVYYLIGAADDLDAITQSTETSYTVTTPTANITLAAWFTNSPVEMIFVAYDSKVPLAQINNYELDLGGGDVRTPNSISILQGTTSDTVILGFNSALPVDVSLDQITDTFYGSQYQFYACLMPISYTNAANSSVIQDNIPATFMGLVTADEEFKQIWIQDGNEEYKGVMVFDNSQTIKNLVNVGDMITLIAKRTVYNDNTELIPLGIPSITTNYATPVPVFIDAADLDYNIPANTNPAEKWEGQFVQINSLLIDSYNPTNYEYTAYACDGSQITIDDDAWYHYGSTTPLEVGNIYDITGLVTFTTGHYKLCPRSADDIAITPFDVAEINAPTNQIPDGNINLTIYNNENNPYEIFRFDLVDGNGIDSLPTIIDTLVLTIEPETTVDYLGNDIAGAKFVKNNAIDITTQTPVIEGNKVKFAFGNGDFNATNGSTAEISLWMWFNTSAKDKVIKISINTADQIALDPTCSSSPLKETDETVYSGTFTIFEPAYVKNISDKLIVYPNPATDIVSISTNFTKVEIINTLGQIVKVVDANNIIDLSILPQGIYTLKVLSNNEVITKQIIKK